MTCPRTPRRRGLVPGKPVPSEPLGVLLLSGEHDRAHYAFVLASGAAALGRRVVFFSTNAGCHALFSDWSGLKDAARDERVRAAGVAGLEELRAASQEMGVRLIACEAGLRAEGLDAARLMPGVEVAGVATFLEAVGVGQLVAI
jgi:peroxiredoxin family protein